MVLLENFNISLFETRNHVVGFILTFLLFSFSLLDCTSVDASHYGGLSAKHAPLRWKQFGIASILGGIPRIFWRRRGRNFPQMNIKMSATSAKKQKQKQVKGSTDMQLASFENLRHLLASRESSAKKNLQILSQTNLKKKCEQKKQSQTLYESSRRKRTDAFVGIPSIPSKMPRIPREALFAITHFH